MFEKVRNGDTGHVQNVKGKENPGRRRSLSSTEAIELRAKLDSIANSYRSAENELESLRSSVKVGKRWRGSWLTLTQHLFRLEPGCVLRITVRHAVCCYPTLRLRICRAGVRS